MKTEEQVKAHLALFNEIANLWTEGKIPSLREFLNETGMKQEFESEESAFFSVISIISTLKWVLKK